MSVPDQYKARSEEEEELILEDLFRDILSDEDKMFFKQAYHRLVAEEGDLLEGIPWLTPQEIPKSPRKRPSDHKTGCARSEGFYRVSYVS